MLSAYLNNGYFECLIPLGLGVHIALQVHVKELKDEIEFGIGMHDI